MGVPECVCGGGGGAVVTQNSPKFEGGEVPAVPPPPGADPVFWGVLGGSEEHELLRVGFFGAFPPAGEGRGRPGVGVRGLVVLSAALGQGEDGVTLRSRAGGQRLDKTGGSAAGKRGGQDTPDPPRGTHPGQVPPELLQLRPRGVEAEGAAGIHLPEGHFPWEAAVERLGEGEAGKFGGFATR